MNYIIIVIVLLSIIILCIYKTKNNEYFEDFKQHKKAVVFNLDSKAGFYSIFFFMCEAYMIAKKYGYDFYINNKDWPYLYEKGWHDYFESLTVYDNNIAPDYDNIMNCSHGSLDSVLNDIGDGYNRFTLEEYINCIHEIYKIRPEILAKCNETINNIGDSYTSIFIRRGDKITSGESTYISTSDILSQIPITEKDTLFIQTDDYTVIEEIKSLRPTNRIVSTVPSNKRGSFHNDLLNLSPYERKVWTEEMLCGLYICTKGTTCWTDDSSNVGRFLKLVSHMNTHVYSIDKDKSLLVFDLNRQSINPAFQASFRA